MAIALIATIFGPHSAGIVWIIIAMVIGGGIGIHYAKKVEMTEMPELVAILHSFVGMAAVLVGYNSYIDAPEGQRTQNTLSILLKPLCVYRCGLRSRVLLLPLVSFVALFHRLH